jgi:hypothetical protein
MKVIAKELGMYGGRRRRKGEEFEIASKDDLRSWMLTSTDAKKEPQQKVDPVPETMSEMAKGRLKTQPQ